MLLYVLRHRCINVITNTHIKYLKYEKIHVHVHTYIYVYCIDVMHIKQEFEIWFKLVLLSVKPYLLSEPDDLNVKEGEDATLRCQVTRERTQPSDVR